MQLCSLNWMHLEIRGMKNSELLTNYPGINGHMKKNEIPTSHHTQKQISDLLKT